MNNRQHERHVIIYTKRNNNNIYTLIIKAFLNAYVFNVPAYVILLWSEYLARHSIGRKLIIYNFDGIRTRVKLENGFRSVSTYVMY